MNRKKVFQPAKYTPVFRNLICNFTTWGFQESFSFTVRPKKDNCRGQTSLVF